jgi:hypothetical protein
MEKVTGIFYERGKSINFASAALFVSLMTALFIYSKLNDHSLHEGEYLDFTGPIIISLSFVIPLIVLSLINFFSSITLDFGIKNGKMEITLYKGNTRTIPVDSFKFLIITTHSIYTEVSSRILIELTVKTRNGSIYFTENLPKDVNPGVPIRNVVGMLRSILQGNQVRF